jgi:hypothetical protein
MGPETLFGVDVDDLFAYNTGQFVRIRDRRLGFLNYGFKLAIVGYIVVYLIFFENQALLKESPQGTAMLYASNPTLPTVSATDATPCCATLGCASKFPAVARPVECVGCCSGPPCDPLASGPTCHADWGGGLESLPYCNQSSAAVGTAGSADSQRRPCKFVDGLQDTAYQVVLHCTVFVFVCTWVHRPLSAYRQALHPSLILLTSAQDVALQVGVPPTRTLLVIRVDLPTYILPAGSARLAGCPRRRAPRLRLRRERRRGHLRRLERTRRRRVLHMRLRVAHGR